MAILHGSWLSRDRQTGFFLWGETWRQTQKHKVATEPTAYPFGLEYSALQAWLEEHHPALAHQNLPTQQQTILLPSIEDGALYSAAPEPRPGDMHLRPWYVEGLLLNTSQTLELLVRLPLGNTSEAELLGSDLRFWSQCARWVLDLLVRYKFLPRIELTTPPLARWYPLLDSAIDRERLKDFSRRMPGACRALDPDRTPQSLMEEFLGCLIDARVRAALHTDPPDPRTFPAGLTRQWLAALGSESAVLHAPAAESAQLAQALDVWQAPLVQQAQSRYRTCFSLEPPPPGSIEWSVQFFLQASDDPEHLIPAQAIWSTEAESQETLLAGLGLASRIWMPIERSLQTRYPIGCTLDTTEAFQFLKVATWRLRDSGFGVRLPESLSEVSSADRRLGLRIQATTPAKAGGLGMQSLLNFKWELCLGGQTLTREEFERLAASAQPLVQVEGEWVELRSQEVRAARRFFDARQQQTELSIEDVLRLNFGDTQTVGGLPVIGFESGGPLKQLLENLGDQKRITPIDSPEGFRGELRPYQKLGVGWLAFLEQWGLGACLADDMGLGKTIQLIAFMLHLREQNRLDGPTLLICPTSVMGNWEREIKKFGPSLGVHVHHGPRRPKGRNFVEAARDKQIIVSSYALVGRDSKDFKRLEWQGLVLDEAQNIKNPDAKQTQLIRELKARFRITLTGTPVENRLAELWSILDFLNPGYLGARNFFQRRFAIPIEKYGDGASLATLRSLVQPFVLRRLKSDPQIIQDLPEKLEMNVFCPLTPEQAALYERIVTESLEQIESSDGIRRHGIVLATLVKLKQVCNHPAHFLGDGSPVAGRSGKLRRLEEMLEEVIAEGDRALIFTQFAEWGKLLQAHLSTGLAREVLLLYGGTSKSQREAMIDRFQHDPQGPRLFILSLKAGGVGLNLTRANHVFHFDRWWNPAVENQATDRVFRIGQTKNVQVHKFICAGTLEERINLLIESKKALAEQVVGAGENWLSDLDTDQLRKLLILDRSEIIEEEGA